MANILYIGDSGSGSTSMHRANALKRLGHHVFIYDPYKELTSQSIYKWLAPVHFRTGYRFLQNYLVKWVGDIKDQIHNPDLIWVNSGELLGSKCLSELKVKGCPIVLYNNDDPTGKRDGNRFDSLIKAIHFYDLCTVMRETNVSEYSAEGAKQVLRVFMSYDEEAHKPYPLLSQIPSAFRSDVSFIGTWMRHEKRDEFLLQLIEQNLPISIWGDRWHKSPVWPLLKPYYRGAALSGREYVAAMQGAKVCIGLLSKGNRDLHTQRSLEIPYAGGLLCAKRTSEHLELYEEGIEAIFWSDAEECAKVCKELLANDQLRESIRVAGMRKVRVLRMGNEDVCQKILDTVGVSDMYRLIN